MSNIIVTGFEPFLQHQENPTEMVARKLNGKVVGGHTICGYVLPVSYQDAAQQLLQLVTSKEPSVVMMLGLAGDRDVITPERVAINVMDGAKDNDGRQMVDQPIASEGPAAYFSTLPIKEMVERLQEKKIPAHISNTAGTYVCNMLMYRVLHYLNLAGFASDVRAGFVHIPYASKMKVIDDTPFTNDKLVEAVQEMLAVTIDTETIQMGVSK
ncbi:pyroglutamyl-peptidase I [Bacillus sp. FSL W7-1360]